MAESAKARKITKLASQNEAFRDALERSFCAMNDVLTGILLPLFGRNRFVDSEGAQLSPGSSTDDVACIRYIGAFRFKDGDLKVFEIVLKDAAHSDRIPPVVALPQPCPAALLVCHDDASSHTWQLCFVQQAGSSDNDVHIRYGAYMLGSPTPVLMAASRFTKLLNQRQITISDISNVFSLQSLKSEFINGCKRHYKQFCEYVINHRSDRDLFDKYYASCTEKEIRDAVKMLFARILFIAFIQQKKWLGCLPKDDAWQTGSDSFLQDLYDHSGIKQNNFLNAVLTPLFAAMSDLREDDLYHLDADSLGCVKVPYFDLALFQTDIRRKAVFPKDYFKELIGFFASYQFCLKEADSDHVVMAIDPSIFAELFETFLEYNSKVGAYYTPAEVVRYMCKESIVAFLQKGCDDNTCKLIYKFVQTHDAELLGGSKRLKNDIIKRLHKVRICDPAVGSGAYTMGLLHELNACLAPLEPDVTPLDRMCRMMRNNLFAVDIDPLALDVARIRFTLALASEAPSPHTLLSAAMNLIQGNSLAVWDGVAELKSSRRKKQPELQLVSPWVSAFKRIIHNGGFDIVIANPPYGVKIAPDERSYYKKYYNFCGSRSDIYMLFFEQGFRLTNQVLCFITPDKWLSKSFALPFREHNMLPYMRRILHLGSDIFKTARVDAVVTLFEKNESEMLDILTCEQNAFKKLHTINKSQLKPPFIIDQFFHTQQASIINRLEAQTHILGEFARCEYASVNPLEAYKLKEVIHCNSIPNEDEYKVINTGLIGKYINRWGQKPMRYLRENYDYPVVKASDADLIYKSYYTKRLVSPKLIIKGLNLLDCAIDESGRIVSTVGTLNVRANSMELLYVLSAIINSSLMTRYCKAKYFSGSYCGGLLFTPDMISHLPVPDLSDMSHFKEIIHSVRRVLVLDNESMRKEEMARLNALVEALYG